MSRMGTKVRFYLYSGASATPKGTDKVHLKAMNYRMLFIVTGLLSAGPAFATTRCVTTADELTAALLAAEQNTSESDEIRLHTGHYAAPDGGWRVDVQLRGIVIEGGFTDAQCETQSLDASLTVLDGGGAVRPLTIDTSFGPQQTATGIEVRGLTFENGAGATAGGLKISDAGPIYSALILVERNIFRNNVSSDFQEDNSGGALLAATDGLSFDGTFLVVRDNLFVGNRGRDGAAAMLFSNNAIDVINNTVVGNQSFDTDLPSRTAIRTFTFSQITYSNNLFWNNNPDGLADTYDIRGDNPFHADLAADLFNNDLQAVLGTPGTQSANLSVDPHFVDAAGGNFRLDATSPLIDAGTGTPLGDLGPADLDGGPRAQGASVDIGAYEFALESDSIFENGFD